MTTLRLAGYSMNPRELVPRLEMVWNSLPAQLSKENKKFIYGVIRQGARAKDFELAIMWLLDCGLIHKSQRVNTPKIPLKAYQDMQVFKLFMLDVGLLSASSGLDAKTLLDGNSIFTEFKGALTEQFVMQELKHISLDYIGYWTNERSTSEVDFIIQKEGMVVPIEVKAGNVLQSKSLLAYCKTYEPRKAVRFSLHNYHEDSPITELPLYAVANIKMVIE